MGRHHDDPIESVDAWLSPGCDTAYSVSLCNIHGEVECIGGADDLEEAWEMATDAAEDYAVPARLQPYGDGRVTRQWTPPATHGATQDGDDE